MQEEGNKSKIIVYKIT